MNRRLLCSALVTTGLLAAPSAALADATVFAGPLKVKGYALNITATDGGSDSLSVLATRTSGPSQQMHMWSFKDVAVSVRGGTATIKGGLGRFGAIDARVATSRKARGTVPAGCTGTPGSVRVGRMTGKTRLVLDTGFFGTVAPKALKAQIGRAGKLTCAGPGGVSGGQAKGLVLTSSLAGSEGQTMFSISKDGGKVTQQVMRMDDAAVTAPASVMHMITARTGDAGLNAASDLSSATAAAAGGFLTGTLSFVGEPMGPMSSGVVTGSFTARFDSIGAQSLPEGNDAMLMQR